MMLFHLTMEHCVRYQERDLTTKKVVDKVNLRKDLRSWLKRRKIEYDFEYRELRTCTKPGKVYHIRGNPITLGAEWKFEQWFELTIPDDLWALQFKLTWL